MKKRNPVVSAGDRLGWFAYLTVMGGGVPFWPALFANPEIEEPLEDDGIAVGPKDPFFDTVPYALRPEHEAEPEELVTA